MATVWIIACVLATQAERSPGQEFAPPQPLMQLPAGANLPGALPAAANGESQRLSLAPPGTQRAASGSQRTPPSAGRTVTTVVSSLAIVLGLFFVFVWLARKGSPAAAGALPSEVVQVLGRASLAPRQQMQLVRIGDKLLLVAITAGGAQTLTEITDPAEVQRLAAACEAARSSSATASFRQVLSQLDQEPAAGGFFGRSEAAQPQSQPQARSGRRTLRTSEQSHA